MQRFEKVVVLNVREYIFLVLTEPDVFCLFVSKERVFSSALKYHSTLN